MSGNFLQEFRQFFLLCIFACHLTLLKPKIRSWSILRSVVCQSFFSLVSEVWIECFEFLSKLASSKIQSLLILWNIDLSAFYLVVWSFGLCEKGKFDNFFFKNLIILFLKIKWQSGGDISGWFILYRLLLALLFICILLSSILIEDWTLWWIFLTDWSFIGLTIHFSISAGAVIEQLLYEYHGNVCSDNIVAADWIHCDTF